MHHNFLFDLDQTLLDFHASEYIALDIVLRSNGLSFSDEIYRAFKACNKALWLEFEKGTVFPCPNRTTKPSFSEIKKRPAFLTADEILADINRAISALWKDNDCSSDALPNHILIPVEQFGQLVTRKVSDDSERSILTYVLENNLSVQQGGELTISPCKWCSGTGSNGSDRMVVYMNRVDRICFNLTQPLRRMDTEYSEMRIKIPYIAQFSEVRFLYPSTVRYLDGI